MTIQRLQTVIIIILLVACVGIGASLYFRNGDIASLHDSIGTLSDQVRQAAKTKAAGAVPATEADVKSARSMLEACGQTPIRKDLTDAERTEAVLPYLEVSKKFASLIDDGYELSDACADDSADPRILFLAVKHLPNFTGSVAFGIMSEADPKAATIAITADDFNLVNDVSPSVCTVTGNGASPESQFLLRCENAESATSNGYVLDFQKRTGTDAYKCGTQRDGSCEVLNHGAYKANETFFDDDALRNMPSQ